MEEPLLHRLKRYGAVSKMVSLSMRIFGGSDEVWKRTLPCPPLQPNRGQIGRARGTPTPKQSYTTSTPEPPASTFVLNRYTHLYPYNHQSLLGMRSFRGSL